MAEILTEKIDELEELIAEEPREDLQAVMVDLKEIINNIAEIPENEQTAANTEYTVLMAAKQLKIEQGREARVKIVRMKQLREEIDEIKDELKEKKTEIKEKIKPLLDLRAQTQKNDEILKLKQQINLLRRMKLEPRQTLKKKLGIDTLISQRKEALEKLKMETKGGRRRYSLRKKRKTLLARRKTLALARRKTLRYGRRKAGTRKRA